MFCGKCGANNNDGSQFCGFCGERFYNTQIVQGPTDNNNRERLLFELKGISKSLTLILSVCSVILIILGIVFIVIANMKNKTYSVYSGYNGGHMDYIGSYGGGYVIDEDGRTKFTIAGVVIALLGFINTINISEISKAKVMFFDNHLEGYSIIPTLFFFLRKDYYIYYQEIYKIQYIQNSFILHLFNGKSKRIIVNSTQEAEIVSQILYQRANLIYHQQPY